MRIKKGFTLIELLIVIAVIAILIRIAIPAVKGFQNEARISKVQGDLHTLKVAMETYYTIYGQYPDWRGVWPNWQSSLVNDPSQILKSVLYDPFAPANTPYGVSSTGGLVGYNNYAVYSVGPKGNGSFTLGNDGSVSPINNIIWDSNGPSGSGGP